MMLLNSWSCWDCLRCYQHFKVNQWTLDSSCGKNGTKGIDFHVWWDFFPANFFKVPFKSARSLSCSNCSPGQCQWGNQHLIWVAFISCWKLAEVCTESTSPHELLHSLGYLPSDLPSHSRGRRLRLLTVLQTPSFLIPSVWIHWKCEPEGIPVFQRASRVLRNQDMAFMTQNSTGVSDILPLFLKSFSSYF